MNGKQVDILCVTVNSLQENGHRNEQADIFFNVNYSCASIKRKWQSNERRVLWPR